jgi:hypothetical protein
VYIAPAVGGASVPQPLARASMIELPPTWMLPFTHSAHGGSSGRIGPCCSVTRILRWARPGDTLSGAQPIAVTERSHTRRTARLLRRELPGRGAVMVRASPRDDFHPETWWRDRSSARELALESLRWWNSFGLRDWWKTVRSPDAAVVPSMSG